MILSVVAVGCLLILSYPFSEDKDVSKHGKIILLTDGYSADSVAEMQVNARNIIPVFTPNLSIAKKFPDQQAQFVPDVFQFFNEHQTDTVHMFGNGLETDELPDLKELQLIFHAPPAFPAVASINWNHELKAGESLVVQGLYANNSLKDVKLILLAFGTILDSTNIAVNSSNEFSFSAVPKHSGRAVYSLLAISGKDTLQNEPVPINVQASIPFKTLLLSSSPDFEKTFLKNRLSLDDYEITSSTVISKDRKMEQFENMQRSPVGRLNLPALSKFDVLITDEDAISRLDASQIDAIRDAVEEKGMGLVVITSGGKNHQFFYSHFFRAFSLQQDKKSFTLLHNAINDSNQYKIKIDGPVCLRPQDGVQPLLMDNQSNIYAANVVYGQGRIVATTLTNTYTIALAGDYPSWQSLWSYILGKAARKISSGENWENYPRFSFVNEPATLRASGNEELMQGQVGGSKIDMSRDPLLTYQWKGHYWPTDSGWQSLIKKDGRILNWYAYAHDDWKASRDLQKVNETKKYIWARPHENIQQAAGRNDKWASHLNLYLVILLFICCSILWIEQKLG